MFRVCVHRYLLASFLALMGIAVPCALAQDPNPKPADKSAGDAAAAASPELPISSGLETGKWAWSSSDEARPS